MARSSPIKRLVDRRKSRKRDYSAADLRELVKRLREAAAEVETLAVEAETRGLKRFGVDGASKPDDANVLIRQFIGKVKSGIDNEIARSSR